MYDKVSKLGWIKNDRAEVSKDAKSLFMWGFCRVPGHLATKLSRHRKIATKNTFRKYKSMMTYKPRGEGVIRISSDGDDRMGEKVKSPKNPWDF